MARKGYNTVAVNILIALTISLVVNFSYFVMIILSSSQRDNGRPDSDRRDVRKEQVAADSVAVSIIDQSIKRSGDSVGGAGMRMIRLSQIDRDEVPEPIPPPEFESATNSNDSVEVVVREQTIKRSNDQGGRDPMKGYNGQLIMALDLLFYFFATLLLLTIMTYNVNLPRSRRYSFILRTTLALLTVILLYFMAPHITWRGNIIMTFQSHHFFQPMLLLKVSVICVVAILYGKLYELIYQKQSIVIENERLKNENLVSRYNMLVGQINPHFFFNSLNSLSMLVRENKRDDALSYIDRMSDTFRYIIRDGQNSMTTLSSELEFLNAYKYLLEIRYQGKLFFDINVDSKYFNKQLPALSLQPLIENAVKHNIITSSCPLHITIEAHNNSLTISNPKRPKIDQSEKGTGIGLSNLSSRYKLLTQKDITVTETENGFTVVLPLI